MLGEYEIIHSISISEYEIVVGESKTVPKDERYMCAYIENTGIFEIGKDCLVGESYPDLTRYLAIRYSSHAFLSREYCQYGFSSGTSSVILYPRGGFWYADAELM